jgi:hypothetical protein
VQRNANDTLPRAHVSPLSLRVPSAALLPNDATQNYDAIADAVNTLNATLVICAGFIPGPALNRTGELAGRGVNVLVLSSLRPTITPPYNFVAWGSPRIYEGVRAVAAARGAGGGR